MQDEARTVEQDHGRIETWRVSTIADPAVLAHLDPDGAWPKLSPLAMVEVERRIGEKVESETGYDRLPRRAGQTLVARLVDDDVLREGADADPRTHRLSVLT